MREMGIKGRGRTIHCLIRNPRIRRRSFWGMLVFGGDGLWWEDVDGLFGWGVGWFVFVPAVAIISIHSQSSPI